MACSRQRSLRHIRFTCVGLLWVISSSGSLRPAQASERDGGAMQENLEGRWNKAAK